MHTFILSTSFTVRRQASQLHFPFLQHTWRCRMIVNIVCVSLECVSMEEAPQHSNNEAELIQRTAVAFHFLSGQWFPTNPLSTRLSMLSIAAHVGIPSTYRLVSVST